MVWNLELCIANPQSLVCDETQSLPEHKTQTETCHRVPSSTSLSHGKNWNKIVLKRHGLISMEIVDPVMWFCRKWLRINRCCSDLLGHWSYSTPATRGWERPFDDHQKTDSRDAKHLIWRRVHIETTSSRHQWSMRECVHVRERERKESIKGARLSFY